MLRSEKMIPGHRDIDRVDALNERAFPENERRTLGPIIGDNSGAAQCTAFYDGDEFIGFACVLCWHDIDHLIYFAVEEDRRAQGFGARILEELFTPGRRLIADLEDDTPGSDDIDMRRRRMGFYCRCGFAKTQVRYRWRGEDYVILSRGGDITGREFGDFWRGIEKLNPEMTMY